MKRSCHGHTKQRKLMRYLNVRAYVVNGILETLWALTAREAPRGDIGKLTNEDIAIGIDYDGDEDALVDALVDAKWIDRHPKHRLVIHDWHEHADDAVKKYIARNHLTWANLDGTSLEVSGQGEISSEVSSPPVPVPEPVPEARSQKPVPVRKSGGALAEDDNFPAFRAAAEAAGMQASDPDWSEAREFVWRKLDFEQRIAAIAGMKQPRSREDPVIKALPKNYLARQMWNRRPWEERKGRSLVEEMAHL